MSKPFDILVLIKQVPDQGAKAGINPDGTIDRAKAKRMMNPFDRYALQAALHVKKLTGGTVKALSMGPPPAAEILLEAIEHGADMGYLLSDRRLAASDTLATAYALHKLILHVSPFQMIFCGLQTTDGDTAQVGPQIAERLNLPQISYCEDFSLEGDQVKARRVIEGGYQWVHADLPCLMTVANSYHPLEYKKIRGSQKVQHLVRNENEKSKVIKTVTLDDIEADPILCGLKGSPTIVARTDKVAEIGGSCKTRQGQSVDLMVKDVLETTPVKEFLKL
ncbi:MAG: electron transfer flavoprotein subunit beta/FixA family protein [Vampirovibrio sp.]|nr:electron transfer flavoprotein subunit beta/FixA family protein [Vampirovibrio sp.]